MIIEYSKEVRFAVSLDVSITAEATIAELDNLFSFLEVMPHDDVYISIIAPNTAHREEVLWIYFHNDNEEVEMSKSFLDIEEELGGEVAAGINSILMILNNPV